MSFNKTVSLKTNTTHHYKYKKTKILGELDSEKEAGPSLQNSEGRRLNGNLGVFGSRKNREEKQRCLPAPCKCGGEFSGEKILRHNFTKTDSATRMPNVFKALKKIIRPRKDPDVQSRLPQQHRASVEVP